MHKPTRGNRVPALRGPSVNPQLSTLNSPRGTVLVMVVALLSMLALLATTFLVTSRYDQVATQGAMVGHQMEMLMSLLEGDIRRKLINDLWGDDPGSNNPGNAAYEGYDGPDDDHGWLNGVCGNLIAWDADAGDPSYVQALIDTNDSGWTDVPGINVDGLTFRYAMVIQDLGGLVNVNVARQPDPDLVGNSYDATPNTNAPADWPYTIWAFHANRNNADWGYWWWTGDLRYQWSTPINYFAGFGKAIRGGGPAQMADFRFLLSSTGQLGNLDRYLRKWATDYKDYGRSFDIQDELDLRYPGLTYDGAPYASVIEKTVPSLFSSSRPNWQNDQIPAYRRRLATAIARTTNWQRRREPVRMHPYDDDFWNQPGVTKSLCHEWWYFTFDEPRNDDLMKYFNENRMGFRIPLQRGITFGRMWPDSKYDIYVWMEPDIYGNNSFPALSGLKDFPNWNQTGSYKWRAAPPFQYDDTLTQAPLTKEWPRRVGDYQHAKAPSMMVLMLANAMANLGVPSPDLNPDLAASYTPRRYAHKVAEKNARFEAYRELAGILHLNLADCQDVNDIPGLLFPYNKDGHLQRYNRYGQRAGMEDRPYITEVVIEFEAWPDYAVINADVYRENNLTVHRVDKGTGADLAGLKVNDRILAVSVPSGTAFLNFTTFRDFRNRIQNALPGTTIGLKVSGPNGSRDVLNIPLAAAVKTIAVEVYNPHDHAVELSNNTGSNSRFQRYNIAVPQQYDYANGKRALLLRRPLGNNVPSIPAKSCLLFLEQRGLYWTYSNGIYWSRMTGWMSNSGLGGKLWWGANKGSHYSKNSVPGEISNLVNLRGADGEVMLTMSKMIGNWSAFGYVADVVRNQPTHPDAPSMPASGATPGSPAGIAGAFAEARGRMLLGKRNPVVRLYRPLYMETRATQFMTASDSWMTGATRAAATSRLGTRGADEDDFPRTADADYVNVDARGVYPIALNRSFRFGADLSRVSRLTSPGLYKPLGRMGIYSINRTAARDQENMWCADRPAESTDPSDSPPDAPTEVVDRQMRKTLAEIDGLSGSKGLDSNNVRHLLQKGEARLRFSPYTPKTETELAECNAWYDFVDAFTMGGAAYDNIDNNGNVVADEHGTLRYALGIPGDLMETDPGGGWLLEHSNCWPAYGRINVNTAPREVLQNALLAPTATIRRQLGEAIWDERGGEASQTNSSYKPFKTLGELYGRVSVLNGRSHGFDRFGFDGKDNHAGAAELPDMPDEPRPYVDDLEERNYLWRVNSEIITLRSDTFAAYLRFQARRSVNGRWKIISERRVYSIWDRAECLWPVRRHDGKLHPDHVAPQRLGIQIFGY